MSGSGKTTIAKEIVARLGWDYAEGDEFHPAANVAKMGAGIPLGDEDRWPWLRALAAWIGGHELAGSSAAVTCSALRRPYRDLLRDGHPSVWFVHVDVHRDVLRERLASRRGHYMPASLLDSQLAALEPLDPDEPGTVIPGDDAPAIVVGHVLEAMRAAGRVAGAGHRQRHSRTCGC